MAIRAIYENGRLRPLEPLDLEDGQEVSLVLVNPRDDVVKALGELVMPARIAADEHLDEEAVISAIDAVYTGPPASQAIIDERQEGP